MYWHGERVLEDLFLSPVLKLTGAKVLRRFWVELHLKTGQDLVHRWGPLSSTLSVRRTWSISLVIKIPYHTPFWQEVTFQTTLLCLCCIRELFLRHLFTIRNINPGFIDYINPGSDRNILGNIQSSIYGLSFFLPYCSLLNFILLTISSTSYSVRVLKVLFSGLLQK